MIVVPWLPSQPLSPFYFKNILRISTCILLNIKQNNLLLNFHFIFQDELQSKSLHFSQKDFGPCFTWIPLSGSFQLPIILGYLEPSAQVVCCMLPTPVQCKFQWVRSCAQFPCAFSYLMTITFSRLDLKVHLNWYALYFYDSIHLGHQYTLIIML